MGFALRGTFGFVVAGFLVAAQPGDCDGVQCPVQVAVATSVEPVSGPLSATCLQWCDPGEGGECCFASDPAAVGPGDQQLRGGHGPDAGFAQQCRTSRVFFDQGE